MASKYTPSTITIFKLINGDEIIGEVFDTNDPYSVITSYEVKRPLKVTIVRDPSTGQPGKALMDWIILAPEIDEVQLYASSLLCAPIRASRELADVWLQQTSGLILTTGQLNG